MGHELSFDYEGPPDLKKSIERALQWVTHPILGVNVLDAGLVYGVQADDHRVRVRMATTTADCPVDHVVAEDAEAELFDHLGGKREVEVEIERRPPWSPGRMKVVPIDRRGPCPCGARVA
jgi:metal-sulfur cluster biosynthetic enzyme